MLNVVYWMILKINVNSNSIEIIEIIIRKIILKIYFKVVKIVE